MLGSRYDANKGDCTAINGNEVERRRTKVREFPPHKKQRRQSPIWFTREAAESVRNMPQYREERGRLELAQIIAPCSTAWVVRATDILRTAGSDTDNRGIRPVLGCIGKNKNTQEELGKKKSRAETKTNLSCGVPHTQEGGSVQHSTQHSHRQDRLVPW